MPAKNRQVKRIFILGQPLFRPSARRREARWHAVIDEREPRDDRRSEFTSAFNPHVEESAKEDHSFRRLDRDKLIAGVANLGDGSAKWRRVALICGAGLGKTTNLQWLAAAINRHALYRGKQPRSSSNSRILPRTPKTSCKSCLPTCTILWTLLRCPLSN